MDDKKNNDDDNDKKYCYLQISIAGQHQNKLVVIELYHSECPITCRNFIELISSPETTTKRTPKPCYRGTEFHRIVKNFMVQGGDFENFDGTGGYCCIADKKRTFDDESFTITHDRPGRLSMANRGPNTNGSQFFITLSATPHLNRKHVCFGQVIQGMDVIHAMVDVEKEGTKPIAMQRIVIIDCGMGKKKKQENDGDNSSNSSDDERNKKKKSRRHRNKERKRKKKKRKKSSSKDRKKKKKRRKRKKYYDSSDDDSSSCFSVNSSSSGSRSSSSSTRMTKEDKKEKKDHNREMKRQRRR